MWSTFRDMANLDNLDIDLGPELQYLLKVKQDLS